jgi:ribosomal protein S18 acetylase RimI-like enzyme
MGSAQSRVVRSATRGDRDGVTRMLAAAFQDDPVMGFIFPDEANRRARLPRFFGLLYDGDGQHGARFVTDGQEAATLWRRPGSAHISLREKIVQAVPWLFAAGGALGRVMAVGTASDAQHPSEPHWYLHVAGCSPAHQGKGFGKAAIRAGLARARADGVPAYLETANENNLAFYQALGFRVTGAWRIPDGPPMWSMLAAA